jgi:hypothetical protein
MKQRKVRTISKRFLIAIVVVSTLLGYTLYAVVIAPYFFSNYYWNVMRNLNDPKVKAEIRANLDPSFNFTDVYKWEWTKLKWVPLNETFDNRPSDPRQILVNGKGRCEEFSTLFVSACLALGYNTRLVVAENVFAGSGLHVWAEINLGGSWVHVDPSDQVWNQTSHYKNWNWGIMGLTVKVYAFQDEKCEDITSRYE